MLQDSSQSFARPSADMPCLAALDPHPRGGGS
jgi:hypothetical protein